MNRRVRHTLDLHGDRRSDGKVFCSICGAWQSKEHFNRHPTSDALIAERALKTLLALAGARFLRGRRANLVIPDET